MDKEEIIRRINVGAELLQDGTYSLVDFQNHFLQLISECDDGPKHKEVCERLLYIVNEMRLEQRPYDKGQKYRIWEKRKKEKALDEKLQFLLS